MFAIDQNWLPFVTSASSPGSSRFPIGRRQERRRRKREDPGDEARLSRLKKSDLPTLVYRNLNDICTCLKLRTTKTIVFLHDVIVTSMTRRNVKELGTWIVAKKHCARLWRSESVFCDPFFLLVVGIVSHPYTLYSTLFYFGTLGAEVVLLAWLLAFTNSFQLLLSRVVG